MSKVGWIVMALAAVGALLPLTNACLQHRRSGRIACAGIGLAIGVPALFHGLMCVSKRPA